MPMPSLNAGLRRLPRGAVWLGGMIPLGLIVLDGVAGRLGVDPVRMIEHRSGRTALWFLLASLCVTPLRRLAGMNAIRFRRALGLLGFGYALLHVLAWVWLDMGLAWAVLVPDLVLRPFLLVGAVAFVILLALGVTGNDAAIRQLGAARWRALHRWVYLAALLAGLHWILAEKIAGPWPLGTMAAILLILALRLRIPGIPGRDPR